jgi:hypothetical protein
MSTVSSGDDHRSSARGSPRLLLAESTCGIASESWSSSANMAASSGNPAPGRRLSGVRRRSCGVSLHHGVGCVARQQTTRSSAARISAFSRWPSSWGAVIDRWPRDATGCCGACRDHRARRGRRVRRRPGRRDRDRRVHGGTLRTLHFNNGTIVTFISTIPRRLIQS